MYFRDLVYDLQVCQNPSWENYNFFFQMTIDMPNLSAFLSSELETSNHSVLKCKNNVPVCIIIILVVSLEWKFINLFY